MNHTNIHNNMLLHETSPYLLQHAHNPVQWYPWCDEAFEKAKAENKLVLISIGYSACHWCHVMAHESFENNEVAKLMNSLYINIKVDREERPDVDQIYMTAVQLLTGSGGWPLNCFVLPDKTPVFGGTYFNTTQWKEILQMLANTYDREPQRVLEAGASLRNAIINADNNMAPNGLEQLISKNLLEIASKKMETYFDTENGGYGQAPKFVLPNSLLFLLRYGTLTGHNEIVSHMHYTLHKIAVGGIHDHLGGGFARYTVDEKWIIPHFEKMLYDNAQLLQLYAEGYQASKIQLYKQTAYGILHFLQSEMLSPQGMYYAALDADSEGVEGKFYTWSYDEIKEVLGKHTEDFCKLYEIEKEGNWEDTNILHMTQLVTEFLSDESVTITQEELQSAKIALLRKRNERIRPGTDTKQLTVWNSLLLEALCQCYLSFGDNIFVQIAGQLAESMNENLMLPTGELLHQYANSNKKIHAFADDYASFSNAMLAYATISGEDKWIKIAKQCADFAIQNFYNPDSGFFYYTAAQGELIVHRKTEIDDNVIPSSNSMMLHALLKLYHITHSAECKNIADKILANIAERIIQSPIYHSNYALAALPMLFNTPEVVITGINTAEALCELNKNYYPSAFWAVTNHKSEFEAYANRFVENERTIYICHHNNCLLPVSQIKSAIELLQKAYS